MCPAVELTSGEMGDELEDGNISCAEIYRLEDGKQV